MRTCEPFSSWKWNLIAFITKPQLPIKLMSEPTAWADWELLSWLYTRCVCVYREKASTYASIIRIISNALCEFSSEFKFNVNISEGLRPISVCVCIAWWIYFISIVTSEAATHARPQTEFQRAERMQGVEWPLVPGN